MLPSRPPSAHSPEFAPSRRSRPLAVRARLPRAVAFWAVVGAALPLSSARAQSATRAHQGVELTLAAEGELTPDAQAFTRLRLTYTAQRPTRVQVTRLRVANDGPLVALPFALHTEGTEEIHGGSFVATGSGSVEIQAAPGTPPAFYVEAEVVARIGGQRLVLRARAEAPAQRPPDHAPPPPEDSDTRLRVHVHGGGTQSTILRRAFTRLTPELRACQRQHDPRGRRFHDARVTYRVELDAEGRVTRVRPREDERGAEVAPEGIRACFQEALSTVDLETDLEDRNRRVLVRVRSTPAEARAADRGERGYTER